MVQEISRGGGGMIGVGVGESKLVATIHSRHDVAFNAIGKTHNGISFDQLTLVPSTPQFHLAFDWFSPESWVITRIFVAGTPYIGHAF